MKRAALVAAVVTASACGRTLGGDESAPPTDDAAADASTGSATDATPDTTDAPAPSFCDDRAPFFACEDFERGLPPSRGWTASALLPTSVAPSDRGGNAMQVAVDGATQPADLHADLGAPKSSIHLEVVAKLEPGAVDDVTIARAEIHEPAPGRTLEAHVIVHPAAANVTVGFCKTTDGGGSSCPGPSLTAAFTKWTSVSIDITVAGHYAVTIDSRSFADDTSALTNVEGASVAVGYTSVFPGGGRIVWFDDALATVQ